MRFHAFTLYVWCYRCGEVGLQLKKVGVTVIVSVWFTVTRPLSLRSYTGVKVWTCAFKQPPVYLLAYTSRSSLAEIMTKTCYFSNAVKPGIEQR